MVEKVNRKLSTKPVEKEYLLDFVNKELVPVVEKLRLLTSTLLDVLIQGEGSPEGAVEASPGALYQRSDGAPGTLLYLKQTGTGSSGWSAIA